MANLEKEREKKDTQQTEDNRNIAKQAKNVERYLAKRQLLTTRKDQCNKNIRDLGVLPEEAFVENNQVLDKVRGFLSLCTVLADGSCLQLLKKLRKVNEALKGFSGVNKKAYEWVPSLHLLQRARR